MSNPGVGFDCSGLVQAAYHAANINLPRTAQEQFDSARLLPPGTPLLPGDLVFFGVDATDITHVGIVFRPGTMVDAPHAGADVRIETFPMIVGTRWGSDIVMGLGRPTT